MSAGTRRYQFYYSSNNSLTGTRRVPDYPLTAIVVGITDSKNELTCCLLSREMWENYDKVRPIGLMLV